MPNTVVAKSIAKTGWLCALCVIPLGYSGAYESPYTPGPGKYPRFEAKQADPGVAYGPAADYPLPKTLLYSLGPDELLAEAEDWANRGFNGFFLTGIAPDWSSPIWSADGEPWTIGPSDKNFQTVSQANALCRRLNCEVFLTTAYSRYFEWFNDTAWQQIEHHFRQNAIFARDTGCAGIAIDIEYIYPQYHFNWSGYAYDGYSRKDLVEKMQSRMTGIIRVMYDEFPDMIVLTLPEGGAGLGGMIQTAWIEEAARRQAPGGIHICTEYTYRRPNLRYMLGHAWLNNRYYQTFLSQRARTYWTKKCSIAAGLWPFGEDPDDFHGTAPTVEEFRQAYAASLMLGRAYSWIYSHNARPLMLGRNTEPYPGGENRDTFMQIIADKNIATNPEYLEASRSIRELKLRDYSSALNLDIVTGFAAPREEVEYGLMPLPVIRSNPLHTIQPLLWDMGVRIVHGELIDFVKTLGTNATWQLIGPFPNPDGDGLDTVYPPEREIQLNEEYTGQAGPIRWREHSSSNQQASVDLTKVFQPAEWVCAYALCYVRSERPQTVQFRFGANDTCKLWVNGELIFQGTDEGRALLDKNIVDVTLPAGSTPVLMKICNNQKDWAFIFRITDRNGDPARGVTHQIEP